MRDSCNLRNIENNKKNGYKLFSQNKYFVVYGLFHYLFSLEFSYFKIEVLVWGTNQNPYIKGI